MASEGASNRPDEIDLEHSTDGKNSICQDGQHEDLLDAAQGDAEDSPGKMLIQSVTEILTQSAQSVKALVSGNASPTPSDENVEEKTLLQSVGDKIMQSAKSVTEAVNGSTDSTDGDADGSGDEKTLVQSVQERIAQTTQSVKEAITGGISEETGEEKGVLQAVGEKIVQSAKTVKDAVKGDVHIIPGKPVIVGYVSDIRKSLALVSQAMTKLPNSRFWFTPPSTEMVNRPTLSRLPLATCILEVAPFNRSGIFNFLIRQRQRS